MVERTIVDVTGWRILPVGCDQERKCVAGERTAAVM